MGLVGARFDFFAAFHEIVELLSIVGQKARLGHFLVVGLEFFTNFFVGGALNAAAIVHCF